MLLADEKVNMISGDSNATLSELIREKQLNVPDLPKIICAFGDGNYSYYSRSLDRLMS